MSNLFEIVCAQKPNGDYLVESGLEEDGDWRYYGLLASGMPGVGKRLVFVARDSRLDELNGKTFSKTEVLVERINKILLAHYQNYFFVSHMVVGSNCQGQYLVRALTKGDAKKIVQNFSEDYCRITVQNVKQYIDEEVNVNEFLETIEKRGNIKMNEAASLWSGT